MSETMTPKSLFHNSSFAGVMKIATIYVKTTFKEPKKVKRNIIMY